MKRLLHVVITAIVLCLPTKSDAQIDTVFWFAAPEIAASAGDSPLFLRFLTYDNPSSVTVSQPANLGFTPVTLTIPAHAVDSIDLTPFLANVESPAANVVANNGLKISSTTNISAFYELKSPTGKEIFSLKGQKAMGMDFYTPFQKFLSNGSTTPASFSSIEIVATANNTTVLITPRTAIVGHAANVTYSVSLNAGQTYSARDVDVNATTSLAGSIISSNKPVAVTLFSGALSSGGCLSPMGDQITSVAYTGTDYIIRRNNTTDRVYLLATQNGTGLTISTNSGSVSSLINFGETYEYTLTDSVTYIKTTKPIYAWHVSGRGCRVNGAQVPPVVCAGDYSTAFTRTSSDSLGLILYTRSGFENQFAINGNTTLISPAAFATVPGTSGTYKVARIWLSTTDIPLHSYNEVTNTGDIFGLGLINGSGANGSSYAYFSNFNSMPFVNAGPNDTVCANVAFALNGFVGGGSVTGNWSTNGFGSFQDPVSNLDNHYVPSPLDTLVSPIRLVLTSTGVCPIVRDTILLQVETAPLVNASADQTTCANNADVQLNGSVNGGATTGTWTTLGSGNFQPDANTLDAIYVPSEADKTAGAVQLVLTSTNNGSCMAETDTMNVAITSAPIVTAGDEDTITVCFNNPNVQLDGSVSGTSTTGKWITEGNGIFTPNNLALNATYQPSSNDLTNGSVWLYLESTNNGSCLPVRDSVLVEFSPPPTANAGVNIISCTNTSGIELQGVIGGAATQGSWSGGAGTFTPNATTLNAVYHPTAGEISSGQVILVLTSTDNGNCNAASDNIQISFVAPPFANFNFTNTCLNQASVFEDFSLPGFGSITSWEWDFGDSNGEATIQNPDYTYNTPGTYGVQLITTNSAGCSDTIVKQVAVYQLPTASFTYSATCDINQIIIHFADASTSADAIDHWYYDFGGQGSAATQNTSKLFNGMGNFDISLVVETVNGCKDTVVQTITIPPRPEAGFSYNTSNGLNIGAVFNFIDTSDYAATYYWTFGDGNESVLQNPSNTYFANGTYVITQYVTGALGCQDSASVTIIINTVTSEITTLIPNAISPNADGKNDVWKLDFIKLSYPEATVAVFNQWGQEIYSSTGYDIPWDGYYKGILVPEGTYYYVIDLQAGTENDLYKGAILVLLNDK